MTLTPQERYTMARDIIAEKIRRLGFRTASKACGLNAMRICRYANRTGADDALTHYILADLVRVHLDDSPRR